MTKASDNPFPSILLEDHTDPAAPTSGFHRLFVDTDEKLKMIDHASLVTDFTPAAGLTGSINVVIDGGGAEIADGIKGDILVDFACTLNAWTLLADQSGAIVVDIWKDTLGNFPPTDADSMCSGKEPTIAASGTNATDTTITDWTTDDISAGEILRFNVDSCTTITRATLALKFTRV